MLLTTFSLSLPTSQTTAQNYSTVARPLVHDDVDCVRQAAAR